MIAKVIYFNWRKAEDARTLASRAKTHVPSAKSVTWTGELLVDRPDLYDYVGDIDAPDSESGCEVAFRQFNRVEEGDMKGLKIRSMSVGDLVVFDNGKLYVCQGCGWKEVVGHSLAFWARPKVEEQ